MCFQGPLICYALVTPEVLLVTQMLNFSQFFPHFFVGLPRICLCANVLNFEYWHLFIACKNWLWGYETWMRAIFSWMKNTLFCSQFSPWNTGNGILGLWNSKMLGGEHAPRVPTSTPTPQKKGTNGPLLIQSVTLFRTAGYFIYYCKPCIVQDEF